MPKSRPPEVNTPQQSAPPAPSAPSPEEATPGPVEPVADQAPQAASSGDQPRERNKGRADGRAKRRATTRPTKRVDAALYPEQATELANIAARISEENKQTVPSSERQRITVNTLLRVASEVIIAYSDKLSGANEDALTAALLESVENSHETREDHEEAQGKKAKHGRRASENEPNGEILHSDNHHCTVAVHPGADGVQPGAIHVSIYIDSPGGVRDH